MDKCQTCLKFSPRLPLMRETRTREPGRAFLPPLDNFSCWWIPCPRGRPPPKSGWCAEGSLNNDALTRDIYARSRDDVDDISEKEWATIRRTTGWIMPLRLEQGMREAFSPYAHVTRDIFIREEGVVIGITRWGNMMMKHFHFPGSTPSRRPYDFLRRHAFPFPDGRPTDHRPFSLHTDHTFTDAFPPRYLFKPAFYLPPSPMIMPSRYDWWCHYRRWLLLPPSLPIFFRRRRHAAPRQLPPPMIRRHAAIDRWCALLISR